MRDGGGVTGDPTGVDDGLSVLGSTSGRRGLLEPEWPLIRAPETTAVAVITAAGRVALDAPSLRRRDRPGPDRLPEYRVLPIALTPVDDYCK